VAADHRADETLNLDHRTSSAQRPTLAVATKSAGAAELI
jgi:hypothetical protein